MRNAAAILALLLSAGCAPELELDAEWLPLRRVVEDRTTPTSMALTRGSVVYVRDLATFPPEGARRYALLLHERKHAERQRELGLASWLDRYETDPAFRWAEERDAWRLELRALQASGETIAPEDCARFMAAHYGVTHDVALAFVRDVLDRTGDER